MAARGGEKTGVSNCPMERLFGVSSCSEVPDTSCHMARAKTFVILGGRKVARVGIFAAREHGRKIQSAGIACRRVGLNAMAGRVMGGQPQS